MSKKKPIAAELNVDYRIGFGSNVLNINLCLNVGGSGAWIRWTPQIRDKQHPKLHGLWLPEPQIDVSIKESLFRQAYKDIENAACRSLEYVLGACKLEETNVNITIKNAVTDPELAKYIREEKFFKNRDLLTKHSAYKAEAIDRVLAALIAQATGNLVT